MYNFNLILTFNADFRGLHADARGTNFPLTDLVVVGTALSLSKIQEIVGAVLSTTEFLRKESADNWE